MVIHLQTIAQPSFVSRAVFFIRLATPSRQKLLILPSCPPMLHAVWRRSYVLCELGIETGRDLQERASCLPRSLTLLRAWPHCCGPSPNQSVVTFLVPTPEVFVTQVTVKKGCKPQFKANVWTFCSSDIGALNQVIKFFSETLENAFSKHVLLTSKNKNGKTVILMFTHSRIYFNPNIMPL